MININNNIRKYFLNLKNSLKKETKKINFFSLIKYLFLFFISFLFILPFFLMFMISIKSFSDIIQNNYLSLPKNGWHWENYKLALQQMEFIKFFFNTLRVTFFSTLLGTLCSILTAYALSILDLKFKPVLLMFLLLGLMTTSETLVITNYRTISNAGLVDYGQGPKVPFGTDYAVILPYLVNIVHMLTCLRV
ncbi:MAG: hypothetical protein Q8885_00860 [Candidatus Phytoplasma stylosanthis]|nr:hypothetical protein [Candidatus Phytoplasma stylosanthis]